MKIALCYFANINTLIHHILFLIMKHKQRATLLVALLFLGIGMLQAQFTANGSVQDERGESLVGATVSVKGTTIGATTDVNGNFSLRCPGNAATLTISYTGFETATVEVSSSNPRANVALKESLSSLDEVVISGLATSVKRSNSANAVASISAAQLTGVTTQQTMEGAMYGKFTGAEIRSNSGAPGGGMSIRMRGVTSLFLDQQPLYIIDGVYLDNSTISSGTNVVSAAAAGGNASNQDDSSNRVADIDPEDIESIEILKGASTAAIYGSRAAGGVVIITTKKGQAGKTRVNVSQTLGFNSATRLLGDRGWTSEKVESAFGAAERARFEANGITDYEKILYGNTGVASTSRVSVSGGDERTTFFVGSTYKDEDGIVENTGYRRLSGRINVQHRLNKKLDLTLQNFFTNTTADRGFFNNSNTNTTVGYALAFTKPWEQLEADRDGVFPALNAVGSNVLETVALVTNREQVNRYIGGATANWTIFSSDKSNLRAILRAGLDNYTLRTIAIFPRQLSYYRGEGSLQGVHVDGHAVNRNTNLEAFLVHSFYVNAKTSFRTSLGVQQLDFDRNEVQTTGTQLNGSQTSLSQAKNIAVTQTEIVQRDKGLAFQEEMTFNDQIIATVGFRADKSSNNGDPNKVYYYPKANLAINLHKFAFWTVDAVPNAKLRIAYGQSGRFPGFNDRFSLFNGTGIGTQSGLFTNDLLGNPDIQPERQSELEYGADFGFLKNRVNLAITLYNKKIDDLLIRSQIPTSTGFTQQVQNAGALVNRGIELSLDLTPVKTGNFVWNSVINFWKNQSEVTRLDVPAFNVGGFAASLGQYRIEEGKSATQIVGTTAEGPLKVYGNAEADFNTSFINSFAYKNFDFNFLLHWKKGGDGINLSTLLWDLGGLTWDYDDKTLDPTGQQVNGDYRTSTWFAGNAGPWIEDAGYLRLREIGAYYTLPMSVTKNKAKVRIGASGRNLINIFDYNSYDPEVSNFGNNVLANTVEVTPFPAMRTVNFHLNVTF
jgi:TonB-dependent starch-binding outer membrane protein SusC